MCVEARTCAPLRSAPLRGNQAVAEVTRSDALRISWNVDRINGEKRRRKGGIRGATPECERREKRRNRDSPRNNIVVRWISRLFLVISCHRSLVWDEWGKTGDYSYLLSY